VAVIREFFAPRLALFFFLFAALAWAGLVAWMKAGSALHRRWLTHAKIPFVALALALLLTAALALAIQVLN
jgi:hypothetical protein